MKITPEGWLEEAAQGFPALVRVPSVRSTDLDLAARGKPLGLVWHWTAGPCAGPKFAPALAEEIRTYAPGKDRAASWHVLVAKDGRIFQSVPFLRGSWHVGRPGRIGGAPERDGASWKAPVSWSSGTLFANINRATVGVELENSGRLEKVGDAFYRWPFWLNPDHHEQGPDPEMQVDADRAVLVDGVWYDTFPEAQEMAATRLLQALVLKFRWPREACQYGHLMFDPTRKEDPGPLWLDQVLPRILDRVFGPEVG